MQDTAVVTVAGGKILPELRVLTESVRAFVPHAAVLAISENPDECKHVVDVAIGMGAAFDLKTVGFQKTRAIREGLARWPTVLYCDADIVFLSDYKPELKPGVTLALHNIATPEALKYGFFNSGYIGVTLSGATFPDWWDKQPKECAGSYGDQQCLDRADRADVFTPNHDVGWWQWTAPLDQRPEIVGDARGIMVNGLPLVSAHSHIVTLDGPPPGNFTQAAGFNHALLTAMRNSGDARHKKLLALMATLGRLNEYPETPAERIAKLHVIENAAVEAMNAGKMQRAVELFGYLADVTGNGLHLNNIGACYRNTGDISAAMTACRESLARVPQTDPQRWRVEMNVAGLALMIGQTDMAAMMFRQAREHAPGNSKLDAWSGEMLTHLSWADNPVVLRKVCEWGKAVEVQRVEATREGPLRVGYLSRDFGPHPVQKFIAPVIEHHERAGISTYVYSARHCVNERTAKLRTLLGDRWRDVDNAEDAELEQTIRNDVLDVLVDLGGHTPDSRLRMLAKRMAPTQLSYLGYPASTGLSDAVLDGKIVDTRTDPPGAESEYTEPLIRLPRCYVAWEPDESAPPAARRDDAPFAFGCFATANKLSGATLDMFAEILSRVPHAKLILKHYGCTDDDVRVMVLKEFEWRGIGPAQLELRGWAKTREASLSMYGEVDVALDTWPYNCTTTTCEALWQGVPVVTRAGQTHHSRNGLSILHAANIGPELCAHAHEGFVTCAATLAAKGPQSTKQRVALRELVRRSPLCDCNALAEVIEAVYVRLATEKRGG